MTAAYFGDYEDEAFDNHTNSTYPPKRLTQLTFDYMRDTDGGYKQEQEAERKGEGEGCQTKGNSYQGCKAEDK